MALRATKIPAPIGGWNTRDPISLMQPTDAIEMVNLVPDVDGVSLRQGYTQHAEVIAGGDWVNALVNWGTPFGQRLICSAQTGSDHRLFDVTSTTPTTIKTGYMGGKWKSAVMNGALGLVNGADNGQKLNYNPTDGTTVKDLMFTGVPAAKLPFSVIHVFKSRSYFANGTEQAFWYSELNALGGAMTRFPIDRVAKSSGNVIDIKSWTRDGGDGPDDYFVIFLDTGEVLVYQGSDPGDATDWAIVGRFKLGKVLATTEYGGKIHCVTDADYNVLPDDLLTEGLRRPTKLSGAARDAVRRDASDNWQILIDPVSGLRIVNVPYNTNREQHVLNLRSGGATKFDITANVWATFKGELYFGSNDGVVYRMRDGDDNGSAIAWSVKQAYSDFKTPNPKTVLNYRPFWTTDGNFAYESGLSYDYDSRDFIQNITTSAQGSPWDTSPWETTPWGTGNPSKQDWLLGAGIGVTVSIQQDGVSTRKCTWHHTDYRMEVSNDLII